MKRYLKYIIMAVFIGFLPLSIQVKAAGTDAIQIDESGNVTIVSPQVAEDGAASLQFSLEVDSADAANIEFRFRESNAKVQEFRYDQNTKQLNIYIAGTEALFAANTDSMTLGTILVLDGNGGNAAASVSVVEDSFAYVHGTELKTVDNMALPGTVQIGPWSQPVPTPQPSQNPTGDNNNSQSNNNSQGNNNNSQGNNSNSQGNNNSQGDNNASQGGSNNNLQGNNNISQGNADINSHGNNHSSQGSINSSHGNNHSSQGSGSISQENPDSSQDNNNDLQGGSSSSQSSSDSTGSDDVKDDVTPSASEDEDDLISSWNPAQESTELTQNPETTKETNWLLVLIIVAALVIVAAIAAGAAVLYKKQNQLNNRRKK